jgi:hypothetical protein
LLFIITPLLKSLRHILTLYTNSVINTGWPKIQTGNKMYMEISLADFWATQRLRRSSAYHAGLWYPRSRVRTQPKPSNFSGEKNPQIPSFGGEVKPSVPCDLGASRNHRPNQPAISRP